jgi:hypothetical protein
MPGKTFIQINKPSTKQDSVLCWAFDCAGLFYLPRLCLETMAILVDMTMLGSSCGALTGCKRGNGS